MRCDDCSNIIARCEGVGWAAWEAEAVRSCHCGASGDVDLEETDDEDELVAGDGFQTCEACGDLLSATESRNDGLGAGLCEACQGDTCPRCGCGESSPCEGGCHWLFVDVDGRAICSACATEEEAAWARDAVVRAAEERES